MPYCREAYIKETFSKVLSNLIEAGEGDSQGTPDHLNPRPTPPHQSLDEIAKCNVQGDKLLRFRPFGFGVVTIVPYSRQSLS